MSATASNYVYEIKKEESKRVFEQPAITKEFVEDCKRVACKYRKSNNGNISRFNV